MATVKTLWLAQVDHVTVPGTRCALFYQVGEPTDATIKKRFKADEPKPSMLEIVGLFDMSHVLNDDTDRAALAAFIADGGMGRVAR
jgi:hypothetical protein